LNIILASKSLQRKIILEKLNLKFSIIEPNINERITNKDHENPKEYCSNLAFTKANKISLLHPNSYVIGADTIIYFKNRIIGKPKSKKDATEYLKSFNRNIHHVYTAVCIINKSEAINKSLIDKTIVTFNNINNQDIDFYINNHNSLNKAGGYGIQDWSSVFIKKIDGCYYNVVGFPLPKFYLIFKKLIKK